MAMRYNPPPNWPLPPAGWTPPPGWQPDPAWGPAPDGWQVWIEDAAKRPWVLRHKIASAVLSLLVIGAIGSALGGGDDETTTTPAAQGATSSSSVTPSADTSADGAAQKAEAEAQASADAQAKAEAEAQAAAAARKSPANYATVSTRKFALIAKNPDEYVGKNFVVYGVVTQFDAATGVDTFRADTGPVALVADWYDYDVNTIVTGSKKLLHNVVEDDIVRMYVTAAGSYSYDTQIGGNTTVPMFKVNMINIIGSGKF
jgi:hypothetical protein